MIKIMKWYHMNTMKYQCPNLIINNIIIEKRTNSISLSKQHFNWESFFFLLLILAGVWIALKLCEFQSDHALPQAKFFWSFFQFVWVSKKLIESVFINFFFYLVPEVVVKRITIWGWWGPFCALNKPFLQFFHQEIVSNIGTMWWFTILNKNRNVVIHNTIDFEKKLFFQVFFTFWNWFSNRYRSQKASSEQRSTLHKQKPLPFLNVCWCDGKGDCIEYYLYFQFHAHSCSESLKKHPK